VKRGKGEKRDGKEMDVLSQTVNKATEALVRASIYEKKEVK